MTQTIKLELPTDNAPVLHHMGNALQAIANEQGYVDSTPKPNMKTTKTETLGKASVTVTNEPVSTEEQLDMLTNSIGIVRQEAEPVSMSGTIVEFEKPEVLPIKVNIENVSPPIVTDSTDKLDKNGIPWDNRIHSRGKTRNADDTWRNARCPKDKTADEWNTYISEVETELKELMEIPVVEQGINLVDDPKYWRNVEMNSCGEVNGEEALTEFLNKFPSAEPVSFEQYEAFQASLDDVEPTVDLPVPPITPPVVETITPPVVELPTPPVEVSTTVQLNPGVAMEQVANVATQALNEVVSELNVPKNFGELMKFITTNNKKLTSEAVKQVIADQDLASIALLAPRPDLIPQVHAALMELL